MVDPAFFDYAADAFIRAGLPTDPCLSEFGADFPDFLATFPPCASLVYIGDVARFEWAISRVSLAAKNPLLALAVIAEAGEAAADLRFVTDPTVRFFLARTRSTASGRRTSPTRRRKKFPSLPLSCIWSFAIQAALQIRRLSASTWRFRSSLALGDSLGAACEAALSVEPDFDLGAAIATVFAEGLIVGVEP